jgi:hypothetical protein
MGKIPFNEVQATYLSVKKNLYQQWAVNIAASRANNNWSSIELSEQDYARIILPQHLHPTLSFKPLIRKNGATLSEVIALLRLNPNYSNTNKACWQSLEYLRNNYTPIMLSTQPIPTFDYWFLDKHAPEHLYHVDGLHRLLSHALFNPKKKILAYVAGL